MDVETEHEEVVLIVAFQSYASIPTRAFYLRVHRYIYIYVYILAFDY